MTAFRLNDLLPELNINLPLAFRTFSNMDPTPLTIFYAYSSPQIFLKCVLYFPVCVRSILLTLSEMTILHSAVSKC